MILFLIFIELFFFNLVFSVDNVVIFAGISSNLEKSKQKKTIFFGGLFATITKIAFIILFIFIFQSISIILISFIAGLLLLKVSFDLTKKEKELEITEKNKTKTKSVYLAVLQIIFMDILVSMDNAIIIAKIMNDNLTSDNAVLLFILMAIAVFATLPILLFGSNWLVKYVKENIVISYLCMFLILILALELIFGGPHITEWLKFMPKWSKLTSKYLGAFLIALGTYFYREKYKYKKINAKVKISGNGEINKNEEINGNTEINENEEIKNDQETTPEN